MSERTPIKLQMYLSRGTPKAYLLVDTPHENKAKVKTWLPKSMIEHSLITHTVGQLASITFKLPQWLVEKNNLWEFQK